MNTHSLIGLFLGAALLGGCNVNTPDGYVPTKYVDAAQAYQGNYFGQLNGQNMVFTLTVADNGYAFLIFGDDVLGPNCSSLVGQLTSIWATNQKVGGANFALQSLCKIHGRHVELNFKRDGKARVSILIENRQETRTVCSGHPICDRSGLCTPSSACHTELHPYRRYITGEFKRY